MTTPNQPIALAIYMKKPEVLAKFVDVLGDHNAKPYIQSVLIAAASSAELSKCTNESIFRSALRAASLGLSCDPAVKQAWLVPYWNGKKKQLEAQFQPHYKGLYTLAMRTGKYWQINVSPVYEGQRVLENTLTGLHAVVEENGLIGKPNSYNAAYTDVTVRRKSTQKVIGWIGYFKTKKGFEKSVWMSNIEIEDHARRYVKDYLDGKTGEVKNPNWADPEKRHTMEMKTVLRQLMSWADLSGAENSELVAALQADESETIDGAAEDIPTETKAVPVQMTYKDALIVNSGIDNQPMGDLDRDVLNGIYWSVETTEEQQEAIRLILKEEYQADPPEQPKRANSQNLKELGFG